MSYRVSLLQDRLNGGAGHLRRRLWEIDGRKWIVSVPGDNLAMRDEAFVVMHRSWQAFAFATGAGLGAIVPAYQFFGEALVREWIEGTPGTSPEAILVAASGPSFAVLDYLLFMTDRGLGPGGNLVTGPNGWVYAIDHENAFQPTDKFLRWAGSRVLEIWCKHGDQSALDRAVAAVLPQVTDGRAAAVEAGLDGRSLADLDTRIELLRSTNSLRAAHQKWRETIGQVLPSVYWP